MTKATFYDQLEGGIKQKEIKVASFDFFDTLMCRRVPKPIDVFLILGKKLVDDRLLRFDIVPERFQEMRIQAERRARANGAHKEISIEEIYREFPEGLFACQIEDLINAELAVEKELLFPVAEMIDIINLAARRGKRIIVVSDIYYSPAHLKWLWGDATPGVDITFFTSCAAKAGKYDSLFSLVLKKLRLSASSVLHTGDNYISDVKRPTELGIKSFFIPHGSGSLFKVVAEELIGRGTVGKAAVFDGGLTAIRAKMVLHEPSNRVDQTTLFNYGAQMLGPVLSTFITWVASSAEEFGGEVIIPLMREGHVLSELLTRSQTPSLIRPGFLSRRVMFQASLVRADRGMLESLRFGNLNMSVDDYLELLGLHSSDVPDISELAHRDIKNNEIFNRVLEAILHNGSVIEKVRERAAGVRRGVLRHFERLTTFENKRLKRIVIVDVGWNATIQRLLQHLLIEEGIEVELIGLYLMTTPAVNSLVFDGVFAKGFLVDGGFPRIDFENLSRTLEIFEQSCAPAHGTVLSHDQRTGDPVLRPDQIPEEQRADIDDIQEGILKFHQIFIRNFDLRQSPQRLDGLAEGVRAILRRAMLSPSIAEARLFSKWVHDDNLGSGSIMPILGSSGLQKLIPYKTYHQHTTTGMHDLYWPAAAAILSDTSRAENVAAAVLRGIEPSNLDVDLGVSSELAVGDGGATTDTFAQKFHQPIWRNTAGKTYLRFDFSATKHARLRWTPTNRNFELQIDFLIITSTSEKGIKTETRIDGGKISDFARIEGMRRTGPTVWRGRAQGSAIYFDTPRKIGISAECHVSFEIACRFTLSDAGTENTALESTSAFMNVACSEPINGICAIDSFNGNATAHNGVIEADVAPLTCNGWMIDPSLQLVTGDFFARFTNRLGHAEFIPMKSVPRPDVAEHFKDPRLTNCGFSLDCDSLPIGTYHLSILRITKEAFLIAKESWPVVIGGN